MQANTKTARPKWPRCFDSFCSRVLSCKLNPSNRSRFRQMRTGFIAAGAGRGGDRLLFNGWRSGRWRRWRDNNRFSINNHRFGFKFGLGLGFGLELRFGFGIGRLHALGFNLGLPRFTGAGVLMFGNFTVDRCTAEGTNAPCQVERVLAGIADVFQAGVAIPGRGSILLSPGANSRGSVDVPPNLAAGLLLPANARTVHPA